MTLYATEPLHIEGRGHIYPADQIMVCHVYAIVEGEKQARGGIVRETGGVYYWRDFAGNVAPGTFKNQNQALAAMQEVIG